MGTEGPAVDEYDPRVSDFRLGRPRPPRSVDLRPGDFAERDDTVAIDRQALVQDTRRAGDVKKDARAPNQRSRARDQIEEAPPARDRILAIDVPSRRFEKRRVGVKRRVHHPIAALGRKRDEVREQDDRFASRPQRPEMMNSRLGSGRGRVSVVSWLGASSIVFGPLSARLYG